MVNQRYIPLVFKMASCPAIGIKGLNVFGTKMMASYSIFSLPLEARLVCLECFCLYGWLVSTSTEPMFPGMKDYCNRLQELEDWKESLFYVNRTSLKSKLKFRDTVNCIVKGRKYYPHYTSYVIMSFRWASTTCKIINEPCHEKTSVLHMRKQRRGSASR